MRNIPFIVVVLLLSACTSSNLDMGKAKQCTDKFLNSLKINNFEEAETYYTDDEFYSESTQTRSEKMEELSQSIGKVISYSLIDSSIVEISGEPTRISLTYKVENEKINSMQTFVIQNEAGEYKIISQDVKAGE
ncbi:MAG: hypothetical protein HY951_14685 [Bacteroidia bacterium]|nr:hypothetical protein [Bacteroidia bacterium]